jgi:serine/threonine protein kinase
VSGNSSGSPSWGLAPGAVVAGYRMEARIGAGGMAAVFRASDVRLGRTVALKVLAPALASDQEFRERFIRESRAAAAVEHPHIIPVYAAGDADDLLYIAMRYVPSGDLSELIRRDGQLTAERASRLLSPLAFALDAAHLAGLVHRDVKPANILIDTTTGMADHPYLADFGLAKGSGATAGLTGTGQFIGTLDYAAPEQIGGKRTVPQTDQYSLACVAFTMLTGAAPFPREEPTAVLWAHMSAPPPSVTALRPELPQALDQVLARAMAKTPEERYPTCAAFAEAFRTALEAGAQRFGGYSAPERVPAQPSLVPVAPAPAGDPVPGPVLSDVPPGPDSYADTLTSMPSGSLADQAGKPSDGRHIASGVTSPLPPSWPDRGNLLSDAGVAPGSEGPGGSAGSVSGGGTGNDVQWAPPSSPGGRKGRHRTLIMAIVAAVVVVGGGGALLAAHPWLHAPVLQPTGLAVHGTTTSSLTIDWSGPASGARPDDYEILRDGTTVGTVPGTATSYSDRGLAPDSFYHYQVVAVRGGRQSPKSSDLAIRTVAPPVSAAVLTGTWTVSYQHPTWYNYSKSPLPLSAETWTFTPKCAAGPCAVALNGSFQSTSFTTTLNRQGAVYTGTATSTYPSCGSALIENHMTYRVQVLTAAAVGMTWTATSWTGTMVLYTSTTGTCSSAGISAGISGTR